MMMWRREDDLERELQARRPEPRRELVDGILSRIDGDRDRRPTRPLRLGVAVALTGAMLVALGSFGGLSFAASGVSHAVRSAVHVVAPDRSADPSTSLSSAMVQYKVAMCFHGHTINVDSHAVNALKAAGATVGACRSARLPKGKVATMCFKGRNITVARQDVAALRKLGFKPGFCKK